MVDTSHDKRLEDLLPEDKANFCWFVEPWQAAVDLALKDTSFSKYKTRVRSISLKSQIPSYVHVIAPPDPQRYYLQIHR